MVKKEKWQSSPKPLYKKWWFWLIVVCLVCVAGGGLSGSGDPADSPTGQMETQGLASTPELSEPSATDSSETVPESAGSVPSSGLIRNENLNGRGRSDSGRSEPQYENVIGYAVIPHSDYELQKEDSCFETPWTVPIYEKDKQFYVVSGYIDHKTEVVVKSQELSHEGYGAYSGYLLVERLEDGASFYIAVGNFITKPYWSYDISDAASIGYCIAEFSQTSDYYPVDKSNKKVELSDGIQVLITGKTGLYGGNGPDNDINSIEAIVFKEWKYGYGGVSVFFNEQDLAIIY